MLIYSRVNCVFSIDLCLASHSPKGVLTPLLRFNCSGCPRLRPYYQIVLRPALLTMLRLTFYLPRLPLDRVKVLSTKIVPLPWTFASIFCLLCGYYIRWPLRCRRWIRSSSSSEQTHLPAMLITILLAAWIVETRP